MDKEGRKRVVIENASPVIDNGQFPVKGIKGNFLQIEADVFADGHERIAADLTYKHQDDTDWTVVNLEPGINDRWKALIPLDKTGYYSFGFKGWIEDFRTYQLDLAKKSEAGQPLAGELSHGLELLKKKMPLTEPEKRVKLEESFSRLVKMEPSNLLKGLLDPELASLTRESISTDRVTSTDMDFPLLVESPRVGFSTWYEVFPRSWKEEGQSHGTLNGLISYLPLLSDMGFDVLYLSPIHPIGSTGRKGKNNNPSALGNEPGSPWAIGSLQGGHKSIHPELGNEGDFRKLVDAASKKGMDIAMDLAFQCSPDHPYVREHPEWFLWRPDGSIQYAENPPKKYEDVVPFNFETENWFELWTELKNVVEYWIEMGVKIFRVDNPHTKPLIFWEWLIGEIRKVNPEVFFLAEAFTRPRVMYRLSRIGFSQSYTYFTWRNSSWEIKEYMKELCDTDVRYHFRPNFWPNTPDILPEFLQYGGRPAFIIRLVLAATLSSNYGIYGPVFDLCIGDSLPDREEYSDSEKYEIRQWDLDDPYAGIRPVIKLVNQTRKDNLALQESCNIIFFEVDNGNILFFGKADRECSNIIFVAINLDPFHTQSCEVNLPLAYFGISDQHPYLLDDLLRGEKYIWNGCRNSITLDPYVMPAAIFSIRTRMRRENDFDYFL